MARVALRYEYFSSRRSAAGVHARLLCCALGCCLALCYLVLCGCDWRQARTAQLSEHLQRGQRYLAAGDLRRAQLQFRAAVQLSPYSAAARYLSGRAAELLGDPRSAADSYLLALDSAPDFLPAYESLARLYISAATPQRALELIGPALLQHPDDPDLLAVRGLARSQLHDHDGALADAEHALRLAPDNDSAVALRASLYRLDGQTPTAVALLETTLARRPGSASLRGMLADLYLQLNQPAEAARQLEAIVARWPQNLPQRYQLAALDAQAHRPDQARRLLQDAISAQPDNDAPKLLYVDFLYRWYSPAEAKRSLDGLIARSPADDTLQLESGALLQRQGDLTQALGVYRAVAASARDRPAALIAAKQAAAILADQGRLDEAFQWLQSVLRADPHDDAALQQLAAVELARYDPAAAITDLRAVLADRPGSAPLWQMLSRAQLANGQIVGAQQDLRTAIAAAPEELAPQLQLAQLLVLSGRREDAVALLEHTVKLAPTDPAVHAALVRAYVADSDVDSARKALEPLTTAAPRAAIAAYLCGLIDEAQHRGAEATHAYERALQLDPADSEALIAWARLQVTEGRTAQAIAALHVRLLSRPTDAITRNLLAELYLTNRNYPLAIEQLQRAIQLTPKWWRPYHNLAAAQSGSGAAGAAIATLERAVGTVGSDPTLVGELAAHYESQGRIDAAIDQYLQLHRRYPGRLLVTNNLAMLLLTYRRDHASLQQAGELTSEFNSSGDARLLDTAGWAQLQLGNVPRALFELQQAGVLQPRSNLIHYHLGMAQLAAGHPDRARAELQVALGGATPFVGAAQARAALAAIRPLTG